MRVFGVGTSDCDEPLHIIPHELSKPSVIGFYHGTGKLDIEFFTRYLLFEFRRLHPGTDPDDPEYLKDPQTGKELPRRRCAVRIRCCCADADARHVLASKYI